MRWQPVVESHTVLRYAPEVLAALDLWWEVQVNYLEEANKPTDRLDWEDYFHIFRRVYKTMVPVFDSEEALTCIQDDWAEDSHGSGFVYREDFYNAVFELADTWTDTAAVDAYVIFLLYLLENVSDGGNPPRFLEMDLIVYSGDGLANPQLKQTRRRASSQRDESSHSCTTSCPHGRAPLAGT